MVHKTTFGSMFTLSSGVGTSGHSVKIMRRRRPRMDLSHQFSTARVVNRWNSLQQYKLSIRQQWRRQLWGTRTRAPPPLPDSNIFIFSSIWSKYASQLSKYCVACEISWCRCQQLTALSISTALVTKLLVIEQLLHPALKFAVSAHDQIYSFAPPHNKSWQRHWIDEYSWGM